MIQVISEHSADVDLLPEKATVLDLGCRGLVFADFFRNSKHRVCAVDIDRLDGDYHRYAVSGQKGIGYCKREHDLNATNLSQNPIDGEKVEMVTIEELGKLVGVEHWDLIKMDIEGEEYGILKNVKHPIASQITVEFHAHRGQKKADLDELLDMLSEFYHIFGKVWENKHGAGFNYWDVLLIDKRI